MSATSQYRETGQAGVPGQLAAAGQAAAAGSLATGLARRRRATVDPGKIYLGWQHALPQPDPGPMPRRPAPPELEQLSQGWLAAQRREESRLARPPKLACLAGAALACITLAMWLAGLLNVALAVVGVMVFLAAAAGAARVVWRGEQQLRACIDAEKQRIAKISAAQQSRLAARQELHAAAYRGWEQRRAEFDRQPQWYAVSLPAQIDRVDVAGGTLPGWSAMLTMIAAPRLSAGGEVTVLDLTEGSVARDLLAVARRSGIDPLVWVMPGDLPLLDLGTGLGSGALADVLAQTVSASDDPASASDPAAASAILARVLDVLGGQARIAHVTAALRVLAQVGDPRDDLCSGLLTARQLERILALFGRGAADRVVIERAWVLESRLRTLEQLGSAPVSMPPSRLRVAWLDRRSGAIGNNVLGTYLAVALTHMLRQAPARRRWEHTLCVLGAEKLRAEVLDRLEDACQHLGNRAGDGLPLDSRADRRPNRPGERERGLHAARQCAGREIRQRADRHRAPFRAQPAHRHGGDIPDGLRRRLLHQHGRHGGLRRRFCVGEQHLGAQQGPRPQPPGRVRAIRRLHRHGQPGLEPLARYLRLAFHHRGHQLGNFLGSKHVESRRHQRLAGQGRTAIP